MQSTLPSSNLTSKKEVAALLQEAGIHPSKRLGQNFLIDRGVLDSIVNEVRKAHPREIVEIGAGLGTVTHELAGTADHIIAIELDRRLAKILERTVGQEGNVEIRRQDFLSFSFAEEFADSKAFVVGNIPYRITAPILKHILAQRDHISSALLLTQREVAAKIAHSPGKEGTSLGVLVQSCANVRPLRSVPRGSFFPVPEVDSTLWSVSFLNAPRFEANAEAFFAVVRAVYGKRRKMIRSALRDLFPNQDVEQILLSLGIDPKLRGEALSFTQLNAIALSLANSDQDRL